MAHINPEPSISGYNSIKMSLLQSAWKKHRNTICAAALLMIAPTIVHANIAPDECLKAEYLVFPAFAADCVAFKALEDQLTGKRNALENLKASVDQAVDDINDKRTQFSRAINEANNAVRISAQNAWNFQQYVAQQTAEQLRLKAIEDVFKNKLWDEQAAWRRIKGELEKKLDIIPPIINQLTKQNLLIDLAIDEAFNTLQQMGINTNISLGNFEMPFSLTLNPVSGSVWFDAKLPTGLHFTTTDLEALMHGTVTIPQFDPVEVAINNVPLVRKTKNDWTNWAAQNPTGDKYERYISSKRFSDFFGSDQLGADTVSAILSGGSSIPGALDRARSQLVMEWSDFLIWAKETGQTELANASGKLFGMIIRGEVAPHPTIASSVVSIPYDYSIDFDISRVVPFISSIVKVESPSTEVGSYSIPHLGFIVTANGLTAPSPKTLVDKLLSKDFGSFDPAAEVSRLLPQSGLDANETQWLSSISPTSIGRSVPGSQSLFSELFKNVPEPGNADSVVEIVKSRVGNDYVVDLKGTFLEQELNQQLGSLVSIMGMMTSSLFSVARGFRVQG